MLRILSHGGINTLLCNNGKQVNITGEISIWDNVVVTPLEKAYLGPEDGEIIDVKTEVVSTSVPELIK